MSFFSHWTSHARGSLSGYRGCRLGLFYLSLLGTALCTQAIDVRSRDPYYGAVVIDAATGEILQEDHASAVSYPASMVKLANLFVVLDDVRAGKLRLDEPVIITREAEEIGAQQVWLKEGEVFPLEELIYAMMVHSANDAATAVAIRTSGSREAHAARMTAVAQRIGLNKTVFHSVHGLPPGKGQEPDLTSALEMARLAKALLDEHPETLRYTSVAVRPFRKENPLQLTSSNKLLDRVAGCDGLKTGYIAASGFSITATAQRDGRRVIAVILGSKDSKVRDAKAAEWIEAGFAKLPPLPPPEPVVEISATEEPAVEMVSAAPVVKKRNGFFLPMVVGVPLLVLVLAAEWLSQRRKR